MADPLPLIPATVVGSHGKPGWWFTAVKAHEAGELGPADLEELFDDAADTAIRDMERAGLDIITDGEVRRLDGYVDSYYAIIKGIEPTAVRRKVGPWGYDQQTRYEAVGRIEAPPGGLGIVKEFEYLRAHTTRRTKATCAGPLTFGSRIHPGRMYKGVVEVAERFAEVINAELRGLVAAGADFIQIDEPARGNVSGAEMARLFNRATEGVTARLAYHICFGNRFGRSRFDRSYRPYFPGPARGARRPARPRVRRPRAGRARPLEGVRPGPRAGGRRDRRQGLLPGDARGRGPAHPPRPRRVPARAALRQPGLRLRLVAPLHVQPEGPRPRRRRRPRPPRPRGPPLRPAGAVAIREVTVVVKAGRGVTQRGASIWSPQPNPTWASASTPTHHSGGPFS